MALNSKQKKRVEYIENKFKYLERQVENLKDYLEGPTPDSTNAQLRLTSLTTLYKDYHRNNIELASLQSDHPFLNAFFNLESDYYDVATNVTKLQKTESTFNPNANSTLNTNNITITERQNLPKLPDIQIPTFDGKPDKWLEYKNRFVALVHSRNDLSNVVKHCQLLNSLTGSAKAKIVEFDPSEEDYPRAWQALTDAYDHKRIIVVEHLNAILDLPKLINATPDTLSALLDKARQHLHMLERLGEKPSDQLVVRIIERCLPQATRSRWHDKLELDRLPSLEELFKFIQTNIFKLQALQSSPANGRDKGESRKRHGEKLDNFRNKNSKFEGRSLVTSLSNSSKSTSSNCPKCNKEHAMFKCPSFQKLSTQDRWEFVKSNKICRNCLRSHPFPCKNDKHCKKCDRNHHTLLHNDKIPQQSKGQTLPSKDAQSSS